MFSWTPTKTFLCLLLSEPVLNNSEQHTLKLGGSVEFHKLVQSSTWQSKHLRVTEKNTSDQVILVEICTGELWDHFHTPPPLLRAVFYFLRFVKSSSDRHVWLIWQPSFRRARQEREWRGMSHCATSLWHATPLHSPAERDCAVCQRRPHSFPRTRVDTSSQGELIVGGQHLLCGGIFFLLGGRGQN